jgi:hypothetical protein
MLQCRSIYSSSFIASHNMASTNCIQPHSHYQGGKTKNRTKYIFCLFFVSLTLTDSLQVNLHLLIHFLWQFYMTFQQFTLDSMSIICSRFNMTQETFLLLFCHKIWFQRTKGISFKTLSTFAYIRSSNHHN